MDTDWKPVIMSSSLSRKQNIKELDLTGWAEKRRRGSERAQNVPKQKDLLTNLPDDVLYHIFSFLGDNDLIRLWGVSRKFQHISATSPYLKFSLSGKVGGTCKCEQFRLFMKNLLELRKLKLQKPKLNEMQKIVQLQFSFGCIAHGDFAIHEEWMKNASQCGIEKLHLKIDVYKLPIYLISCESIRELHLRMRNNGVKLPPITLASLETLIMDSVQVTMSVGLWISKHFPSLKCLSVKNITTKTLDISIPSLENVMISDDYISDIKIKTEKLQSLDFRSGSLTHYHKSKERKVEIKAPNLQILRWEGVPRRFSCLEELRALQRAIINAEEWHKDSKANVNCARLVELLQGVRWARHLHLDSWILKVLLNIPPIMFENLSHLSLRLEREDAHYIIPFLEKYGDINSLCIEESRIASYRENWGSSSNSSADDYHQFQGNSFLPLILASNFKFERIHGSLELGVISIHGLKVVKIKITQFKKEIILVIHMLMKAAKDLVKMTITYPSHWELWMKSIGLQNLINNFEKASPSLAVYMVPK